jgi:hypothetical protein
MGRSLLIALMPTKISKQTTFIHLNFFRFLGLALAGLRLGLKNRQVSEKWVSDDCSYLCKGL